MIEPETYQSKADTISAKFAVMGHFFAILSRGVQYNFRGFDNLLGLPPSSAAFDIEGADHIILF